MHQNEKQERTVRFEALCRERGLPLTVQRRTVLEAILDRDDHPTAEEIHDAVSRKLPAVSRATVYRILDMLVEFGIIAKICHPGSAARFDPNIRRHHHLVCVRCEKIIDIADQGVGAVGLPSLSGQGFHVSGYQIHFLGTCAPCRAQPEKGGVPACEKTTKGDKREQASRKPTRSTRKRRR